MLHAWDKLGFFGGHVLLDFVNAVDDEGKSRARNGVPDWQSLLAWSVRRGVLDADEHARLSMASDDEAARAHADLMAVRESAYATLSAIAAGVAPSDGSLDPLADWASAALARARLMAGPSGLAWTTDRQALGADLLQVRLGLSLLDLIACADFDRLRECGRCTGLFLDHGRGRGRRWCRMATCGNRSKVARHRRVRS